MQSDTNITSCPVVGRGKFFASEEEDIEYMLDTPYYLAITDETSEAELAAQVPHVERSQETWYGYY